MIYNHTPRPEGAESLAQGNALCREAPHHQQALKGRNQNDIALTGLNKTMLTHIHRALPYVNDTRLSALYCQIVYYYLNKKNQNL